MKRKIKITITKTRRQTTIVQPETDGALNLEGMCPVCGSKVETSPADKPEEILDEDVKCFCLSEIRKLRTNKILK